MVNTEVNTRDKQSTAESQQRSQKKEIHVLYSTFDRIWRLNQQLTIAMELPEAENIKTNDLKTLQHYFHKTIKYM